MIENAPYGLSASPLQVAVAPLSGSNEVSVPLALGVPLTGEPSSLLPASTTVPAAAAASEVTVGASLVPVIVMVRVEVEVAPAASLTV